MLLALCHRCWTWMEPKLERCIECGGAIQLQDPDPSPEQLVRLFGASLGGLGDVSWKRPKLPSFGTLSLFEQGLLFLPDLRELPTGALAGIEVPAGREAPSGFWSLFRRRTSPVPLSPLATVRPSLTPENAVDRFLNSPGASFVRRETILRIIQRGTLLRVERKPGRTVAWRLVSSRASARERLGQLKGHPDWQNVSMTFLD